MDKKKFILNLNSPEMQAVLKEVYLPVWQLEGKELASTLSSGLSAKGIGKSINDQGTGFTQEIVDANGSTVRGGSHGAFKDNLTFAKPTLPFVTGPSSRAKIQVTSTGFQSNIGITMYEDLVMKNGTKEGFFNHFEGQAEEIVKSMKIHTGRMLFSGRHGVISVVSETPTKIGSAATTERTLFALKVRDFRFFKVGDEIQFAGVGQTLFRPEYEYNATKFPERADALGDDPQTIIPHTKKVSGVDELGQTTSTDVKLTQLRGIVSQDYDGLATFLVVDRDVEAGTLILKNGSVDSEQTIEAAASLIKKDTEIFYHLSRNGEMYGLDNFIGSGAKWNYLGAYTRADGTNGFNKELEFVAKAGNERPRFLRPINSTVSELNKLAHESDYDLPVFTQFNETLTPDMFEAHIEKIQELGGELPSFFVASKATAKALAHIPFDTLGGMTIQRVYINDFEPAKAVAENVGPKSTAGTEDENLNVWGYGVNIDQFAPSHKLYMLNLDTMSMLKLKDLAFVEMGGQIWDQERDVNGNKLWMYTADMVEYKNLYMTDPRKNGIIDGIAKRASVKPVVPTTMFDFKPVYEEGQHKVSTVTQADSSANTPTYSQLSAVKPNSAIVGEAKLAQLQGTSTPDAQEVISNAERKDGTTAKAGK